MVLILAATAAVLCVGAFWLLAIVVGLLLGRSTIDSFASSACFWRSQSTVPSSGCDAERSDRMVRTSLMALITCAPRRAILRN